MVTLLFWNTKKRDLEQEIGALCGDHSVDVAMLAECDIDDATLLGAINSQSDSTYIAPFDPSPLIRFISRLPAESLIPVRDEWSVAVRTLKLPIGPEISLVAAHLPSKLHMSTDEQTLNAVRVSTTIRETETEAGHSRTVVIGDLNMNPFEAGMVAASAFHATMDANIAKRYSRKVRGLHHQYFYNPMWNFLGDATVGPPGTYFRLGGEISTFWNMLDQVLLRPSLLPFYNPANLRVITRIGGRSLLKRNGRIDNSISDHLPIVLTLSIEQGVP